MSKISENQKLLLVQFMEENIKLIKGKFDSTFRKTDADNLWAELTDILNGAGGANKTIAQWRKTWSDLKVDAKKKAGVIGDNLRRTGGGPPPEDIMTDVQKRIVGLLGPVSVEGIESAVEVGINNDEQAETSMPEYEIVYNIDDDNDEHLEVVEEQKKKRKLANNEDTQSGSNKKVRKSRVQQSEALLEIEERKTSALENISLALGRIADAIWAFTKI